MAARTRALDDLIDHHLDLAWGWWTELGVPGSTRIPVTTTVHPEALVVFTAPLMTHDARLREQVIGWLLAHGHRLGSRQLQAVSGRSAGASAGLADLAATLRAAGGPRWVSAGDGTPLDGPHVPSDRPLDLVRPASALLRLRAAMGVHARAEILVVLGAVESMPLSHADLAPYIASTPRNVRLALDDLVLAGVVQTQGRVSGRRYVCSDAAALRAWIGPIPPMPAWATTLPIVTTLRHAILDHATDLERAVAVQRVLDQHADAQHLFATPPPRGGGGRRVLDAVVDWMLHDRHLI